MELKRHADVLASGKEVEQVVKLKDEADLPADEALHRWRRLDEIIPEGSQITVRGASQGADKREKGCLATTGRPVMNMIWLG